MRFVATGMQGWRRSMEDAHIANVNLGNGCSFFGVFDGHGGKFFEVLTYLGQEVATYVKKHYCRMLTGLASFKSKMYKEALEESFLKIDEMMLTDQGQKELIKIGKSQSGDDGYYSQPDSKCFAGCTATVLLVTPTEIYCANSGDSRTVLSKSKIAMDMSKDHKPDDPEERKRIYNAGGFVEDSRVNGMLALSRALGDFEYKSNQLFKARDQAVSAFPDVKCITLDSTCEFVVLACDGIWDVMTSQQVITFMHNKAYGGSFQERKKRTLADLTKGIEQCLDECCATDLASSQGLGCDNMTAIIVEFI